MCENVCEWVWERVWMCENVCEWVWERLWMSARTFSLVHLNMNARKTFLPFVWESTHGHVYFYICSLSSQTWNVDRKRDNDPKEQAPNRNADLVQIRKNIRQFPTITPYQCQMDQSLVLPHCALVLIKHGAAGYVQNCQPRHQIRYGEPLEIMFWENVSILNTWFCESTIPPPPHTHTHTHTPGAPPGYAS